MKENIFGGHLSTDFDDLESIMKDTVDRLEEERLKKDE